MGKIYLNQDVLKIEFTYNELPGEVSTVSIRYQNPAGRIGSLPGEAIHNEPASSYYYIFEQGETLKNYGPEGVWKFWLLFELTDLRKIPGEPVTHTIYREGA